MAPLKRTPIPKVRSNPRPGRPTGRIQMSARTPEEMSGTDTSIVTAASISSMIYPAPKPKKRKREPVVTYPDGREVCDKATLEGRREYERRTMEMASRQKFLCAICNLYIPLLDTPTFDHERSRGHGGGFRDDRIEVDGEWKNAAVHMKCNGEKGSKRYRWKNGKYIVDTD